MIVVERGCQKLARHRNRGMIQAKSAQTKSALLSRVNPAKQLVLRTGNILGATQILKKIKTESKENRNRSISLPPWPP
jgi:hypothetical protein